jgi:hypothetical protein
MRVVTISVGALALIAGVAVAELREGRPTPKAAAAVAAAEKAEGNRTVISSGAKAAKDENGRLRAPTAEESAALTESSSSSTVTAWVNADGSVTAALGTGFMSDTMATKNADGSISVTCAEHEQSGHDHVVHSSQQTPVALETE